MYKLDRKSKEKRAKILKLINFNGRKLWKNEMTGWTTQNNLLNSSDQLADIFTKSLREPRIDYICNKLGTFDLYAPA